MSNSGCADPEAMSGINIRVESCLRDNAYAAYFCMDIWYRVSWKWTRYLPFATSVAMYSVTISGWSLALGRLLVADVQVWAV